MLFRGTQDSAKHIGLNIRWNIERIPSPGKGFNGDLESRPCLVRRVAAIEPASALRPGYPHWRLAGPLPPDFRNLGRLDSSVWSRPAGSSAKPVDRDRVRFDGNVLQLIAALPSFRRRRSAPLAGPDPGLPRLVEIVVGLGQRCMCRSRLRHVFASGHRSL